MERLMMNRRYLAVRVLLMLTLVFLFSVSGKVLCQQRSDSIEGTTLILTRHAEKVDSSADTDLSEQGRNRAKRLAALLHRADIRALYASEFKRTQQTLQPLSEMIGIPVQTVQSHDLQGLIRAVYQDYRGETVVVSGHSDTVPQLILELGGEAVGPIGEMEYDNLFVVTVLGHGKAKVVRISY
jgi:broad specificity phosphatase PhoE